MPLTSDKDPYRIALKRLNRILTLFYNDFETYTSELLKLGQDIFECESGLFSRLDGGFFHVRGISGNAGGVQVGDRLAVENTLCALMVGSHEPLALNDLEANDTQCHPALLPGAGSRYIGIPLYLDGALYGTMSFACNTPRPTPFTNDDLELISLMASGLSAGIKLEVTQDALRCSRDHMQLILDNIPTRIWFKDDENRILKANRAAAQSMGFNDPDMLEGADTYKLFPKQAAKYHADDLEVLNSGNPCIGIIERYTPVDGTEGWISTDKIPVRLLSGQRALLVASTDITAEVAKGDFTETTAAAIHEKELDYLERQQVIGKLRTGT